MPVLVVQFHWYFAQCTNQLFSCRNKAVSLLELKWGMFPNGALTRALPTTATFSNTWMPLDMFRRTFNWAFVTAGLTPGWPLYMFLIFKPWLLAGADNIWCGLYSCDYGVCFHDMILTTFSILLDEEGHIKLTGESFCPSCSHTPVCVCVCACACVIFCYHL